MAWLSLVVPLVSVDLLSFAQLPVIPVGTSPIVWLVSFRELLAIASMPHEGGRKLLLDGRGRMRSWLLHRRQRSKRPS